MTPEEVQQRLAEPFAPDKIGWKPQSAKGNRALAVAYIDARDVMDRLDAAVGGANWATDFEQVGPHSVECRLSVRVGGEWVKKTDVGSTSDQPDDGDKLKAAYSDALKRAAVQWGIGRYLYSLPAVWCDFDPQKKQFTQTPRLPDWAIPKGHQQTRQPAPSLPEQAPAQQQKQPAAKPKQPPPASVRELWERVSNSPAPQTGDELVKWVKSLDASLGRLTPDHIAGELVAAVAEFLRVDPADLAGVKGKDLESGWNNARNYVKACETPAEAAK